MAKAKKLKAQDPEIIDLAGGEPDFDTPKKICDELFRQINAGFTHYTVGPGLGNSVKHIDDPAAYHNAEAVFIVQGSLAEKKFIFFGYCISHKSPPFYADRA